MIYFPFFISTLCLLIFKNTAWVPMIFVILGKLHKLLDKMEIIMVPTSPDLYENLKSHAYESISTLAGSL